MWFLSVLMKLLFLLIHLKPKKGLALNFSNFSLLVPHAFLFLLWPAPCSSAQCFVSPQSTDPTMAWFFCSTNLLFLRQYTPGAFFPQFPSEKIKTKGKTLNSKKEQKAAVNPYKSLIFVL